MAEQTLLGSLTEAVLEASRAILALGPAGAFETKSDGSPVSVADHASNQVLLASLAKLFPHIPVISEESENGPELLPQECFLVDPLDGTKEYLSGLPEYTVNLAWLRNGRPIYGWVAIPATNTCYFGDVASGLAWKLVEGQLTEVQVASVFGGRLAMSRSHSSEAEDRFSRRFHFTSTVRCGSSLKGCLVAEGTADAYVRYGDIMAWDIAAMDAVVVAAGGELVNSRGQSILYVGRRIAGGFLVRPRSFQFLEMANG